MITNLFSMFDPRSSFLSLNWIILIFLIYVLTWKIWKFKYSTNKIISKVLNALKKEVKFSLKTTEPGVEIIVSAIFLVILIINFLALYPQIFSLTSHLIITLPLSISFWLSTMIFAWTKKTYHMICHLLPQGTPRFLIMFIVLIELTSNLIRPLTLCVRLTANLIAGHLLISLLGSLMITLNVLGVIYSVSVIIILTVLESAVACIQAYVFITLITLYLRETK